MSLADGCIKHDVSTTVKPHETWCFLRLCYVHPSWVDMGRNLAFNARMNTAVKLHQHAAVIDKMGGSTAVARLFGYTPQRVQNWKYRGVPDAARLRMIYEMKVWPPEDKA